MTTDVARRRAIIESETVALFSRWIGGSQVRVRVRTVGKQEKIIVDLLELSPDGASLETLHLNRIAANAAILHSAASTDYCVIHDYATGRKTSRVDGTKVLTNIREKSYVFHGVNA